MYRTLKVGLLAALIGPLLSSCTTWHNSYIPEDTAKRQFDIDNGYCKSASFGAVGMPEIREYQTSPAPYTVQTYGQVYDPYRGTSTSYQATSYVTPLSNENIGNGFAQGMQIGNAWAASQARADIYRGCMLNLGWSDSKGANVQARVASDRTTKTPSPDFYSALAVRVPNYASINADPRFHDWLKMRDAATGKQRQLLLVDAERKHDADSVAALFKQFLSTL
ncbi:hypothetical protein K0P33_27555 [Pseudomonas sp. ArH3a]|uniref:hypothetical protein n=1 Tax=Pseudomonas sp. ArH3a TaxID=2862945 RepID=UPI001F57FFE6|nr:hypothetical protein [Pseudomonas sp. ArH3a]UNM19219.1 hypothetical protein K0P33_27555 [Pseudomonas sp. ArH3a]